MKKLTLLFIAGFVVLAMQSCNNKALEFNNKIVEIQKSVEKPFSEFGKKMQAVGASGDLKSLDPGAREMLKLTDEKIAELTKLESPEGGDELKNSMIDQFKMARNIYSKTIILAADTTSPEVKFTIGTEFMEIEAKAAKLEAATKEAQRKFAEKNGFKLKAS